MPAQSQQQQKLFGLALSVKRRETPRSEASKEVLDIVDSMTEKEIEDFASTSHSGLPSKVEAKLRELVRDSIKAQSISVMENTLKEGLYQDIMRGVKKGDSPFTLVVIKNNKVVKQVEVKTGQAIPANYSSLLKEFPNSRIRIEDATGKIVMGESVQSLDEKLPNDFATIPNDGNVSGALKHLQHHVDVISKNIKAGKGVYKKDLMKMANIIKSLQKFEGVNEENEPTNPELWDRAIAAAKREYDVYPSAYANAFASKWYKEKGGDWKTKNESVNEAQVADFEIGDFVHFKRLNKTGMVTKISGNKVTIRTPQRFITGDIKDIEVLYQDGVIPSVNEAVPTQTKWAVAIASLTATRPDAVQKFIDDNNLNSEKLYQFLKKSKLDGKMDFVTALVGKPNNPIQKKMIKMFGESVNEGIGTIALGVAGGLLLLKVLKFVLKKVLGTIGMNVPLPKEKLLEVVETMIKTVLTQSSGKQIDMLQLVALRSFLKDEINAGRITTIKQIIQIIDKLSKNKVESVNESSVEIGDIIFFPPANSAATVVDRFGRSVTLKLANGKKVKTVVDKIKLLAQDGVNEHKDCGCGCGTSLTEGQLNEWKAEEVLQQLGGRKFIAMTGANNFVKNDKAKSIIFKLPRAKSGIKYVRITLTSMDVYNIEFISARGSNIKTVATAKGVYNDELQSVFTQYTGLYTSL
jgi:hypothetical protein